MGIERSAIAIRMGPHASTSDFSVAAVTPIDLLPEGDPGVLTPETENVEREPAHPQNKRFGPLRGPIDIKKPVPLTFGVRGAAGNNGGAFTFESVNALAAAGIYKALFGAAAVSPAGAVTTSTGGAGGTATLSVTERDRFPVGSGVLVPTSTGTYARQVTVNGGSGAGDLTLDRVVPGVLVTGNVIRLARHFVDPSVHAHVHEYLLAERGDADIAREFLGGMSLGEFDFTVGEMAKLMTSWMFTNIKDIARASTTLTPTLADVGGALFNCNSFLYDGDTQLDAWDIKASTGGTMTPRKANSGAVDRQGYLVAKGAGTPRPTISFKVRKGSNAGELDEAAVLVWKGLNLSNGDKQTSKDISVQVGNAAGAVSLFRAPSANRAKAIDITVDGFECLDITVNCNGPSGTTFHPLEVLFG